MSYRQSDNKIRWDDPEIDELYIKVKKKEKSTRQKEEAKRLLGVLKNDNDGSRLKKFMEMENEASTKDPYEELIEKTPELKFLYLRNYFDKRAIEKGKAINFYKSEEWQRLRYKTMSNSNRQCVLCGASNTELHVDHIKPRSLYPKLALDPNNLQILCKACNYGKGNRDDTRF